MARRYAGGYFADNDPDARVDAWNADDIPAVHRGDGQRDEPHDVREPEQTLPDTPADAVNDVDRRRRGARPPVGAALPRLRRLSPVRSGVRLAELMAALSVATDLGMGQPQETALRGCVVAMRLGESLHLDERTLRDIYYQSLLRYIGCNADTFAMAALLGDELAFRHDVAPLDPSQPADVVALVVRYIREARPGESTAALDYTVARELLALPQLTRDSFAGHCEVAQRLATRFGLSVSLIACLGQLYERWDGHGLPRGLRGDAVALPVLVVTLAQDAVIWHRIGGVDAVLATVAARSGGAYQPAMAAHLCANAAFLLAGLDGVLSWDSVLALEPGAQDALTEERLDRCCEAIADIADIKSPFLLGHSTRVAALAAGAASRSGLVDADIIAIRRAGLLHDIGRAGVSAGIWGKPGPLTDGEWEQVRLHTYYTDRVLARPEALHRVGALASQHHERLDGGGYHRGLSGGALGRSARILAAADAYAALTEPRPHRSAYTAEEAEAVLHTEARSGRLDGDAVHAVLAEAGHRVTPVRRDRPAGLSAREVEVLRLVARGLTNRDMAEHLHVAPDTVKHHVQHIYDKTSLSTRAGVTLFAMEHGLL